MPPRALRWIPLGKAWLFSGSDRGDKRTAIICTLIENAKFNNIDPQGCLADVLARIAGRSATKLDELLRWNWASCTAAIAT